MLTTDSLSSLPAHGLVTPDAGDVWFAASVMSGLLLFGLAVFLFCFGVLPYWFKVHKHLSEILGCEWSPPSLAHKKLTLFGLGWALTFPNGSYSSRPR